jgi:beta-glucosidase
MTATDTPAYGDASLNIGGRVADLLRRMTLDEKIAWLGGVWPADIMADGAFSELRAATAVPHGIGHISHTSAFTALPPRELAALNDDAQRYLVERVPREVGRAELRPTPVEVR